MKRAALVFGILSLLLFADGGYLLATHDSVHGDTGALFGNPDNVLPAGTVVVISALFLLVAAVIMWLVAVHREDRERRPTGGPATPGQPGPSGGTASRA